MFHVFGVVNNVYSRSGWPQCLPSRIPGGDGETTLPPAPAGFFLLRDDCSVTSMRQEGQAVFSLRGECQLLQLAHRSMVDNDSTHLR